MSIGVVKLFSRTWFIDVIQCSALQKTAVLINSSFVSFYGVLFLLLFLLLLLSEVQLCDLTSVQFSFPCFNSVQFI